jgi:hypothetical protein
MKKLTALAIVLILATSLTTLAIYGTGWGKVVTVTPTAQQVSGFTANRLTVQVLNTSLVYVLANTTATELTNRVAAGTAIAVTNGTPFTFDAQGKDSISSISLYTVAATNRVLLQAY